MPKENKRERRDWTQKEDERLKLMYNTHSQKDIAAALDRPAGSIASRADLLGLKKQNYKTSENRIGTIIRPREGVLVHIGTYGARVK